MTDQMVKENNKTAGLEPPKKIIIGGATSNKIFGRFDMICPTAIMRLAIVCEEGSLTHGEYNWANTNDPQGFKRERISHAMSHLELYRLGDNSEAHLAKAIWGLMAAIHFDGNCQCHKQHLGKSQGREQNDM